MRINLFPIVICLIVGLLFFAIYYTTAGTTYTRNLYKVWLKAYPDYKHLEFPEWKTLKVNGILPGQVR